VSPLFSFSLIPTLFAILIVVAAGGVAFLLWKFKNQVDAGSTSSIKVDTKSDKTNSACYKTAYKHMPDAIVILNSEKKFLYINPAAEEMLSCKLRSMMGRQYKDAFELQHISTGRPLQGVVSNVELDNDETVSCECVLQTSMNQNFPVSLKTIPLTASEDLESNPKTLMVIKNITRNKALVSKLSDLEKYDTLTRMLNRKSFDAEVKHLIESTHKHDSRHVLAYFSIDQFQVINDTVGYAGGDALIEMIGDIIKSHIEKSIDVVGRVGGNEFAVVFCERNLALAVKEIESILVDVQNSDFTSRGKHYPITMSAGFVIVDVESTSSARAISEANVACNLARKRGGNHVYAYKSENTEIQKLEGNLEWIIILKEAIQENRFRMYAQPIHPLTTAEYAKPFHHYELLIRLSDERGKPIPPVEFLSAAEYYSMMPTVDRWVIRSVLESLSSVPDQKPLPVFAINLSGQSLNDPRFLDYVIREVKSSNVDPRMLCFEITEQVAVEDLQLVNNFISSLKALGSSFSLDDFGTGVSSYSYLRSLDVDYLKIDGSFVKNIVDDEVARAMVQSINQVGHTMNLKVIAEYVENDKILGLLREMGVDYGQGYQIQRPTPLKDVLTQHHIANKVSSSIEHGL